MLDKDHPSLRLCGKAGQEHFRIAYGLDRNLLLLMFAVFRTNDQKILRTLGIIRVKTEQSPRKFTRDKRFPDTFRTDEKKRLMRQSIDRCYPGKSPSYDTVPDDVHFRKDE